MGKFANKQAKDLGFLGETNQDERLKFYKSRVQSNEPSQYSNTRQQLVEMKSLEFPM